LGLISPQVTLDVIKSMKDVGDKTGFIPTFFHGDHGASSIAGAYLRGIDNFDIKGTYQITVKKCQRIEAEPAVILPSILKKVTSPILILPTQRWKPRPKPVFQKHWSILTMIIR
jgi:hypothetical protein